MSIKREPLDHLQKGTPNLALIDDYLTRLGYEVNNHLKQPYRHVTGRIIKDGYTYFFKMASTASLSTYIKNEYEWSRIVHARHYVAGWPLSIPRMHTIDEMDELGLSWLTREYISGIDAKSSPHILPITIKPMASTLADIINLKPDDTLPLDEKRHYRNINEMCREQLAIYIKELKYRPISTVMLSFLEDHIDLVETAPARGDVGFGNILQDIQGKIWLIDSEYASFKDIKFYDVAYFYFRLAVDGHRIDLADTFLDEFRNIYSLRPRDETVLQWALIYRLVEGYFEAMQNPSLYPATKQLERVILKRMYQVYLPFPWRE